jgi:hypothetical protein
MNFKKFDAHIVPHEFINILLQEICVRIGNDSDL